MSIDTSKIRAGDTGTIRVRFREMGKDGTFWWVETDRPAKFCGSRYIDVEASAIASHTPAPWVPEKDDVVAWNASGHTEWKIRAIDGGAAWICHSVSGNAVAFLSDLTFIRKEAAP